ncbi:DGQHR domain-containing protein [Paraburkholderia bannensis]|uniref:DGQHR domain-containing protein n=1 Tax=Paraburkholderia bannensis TaxID=765414 RepID=UPI002AB67D58|nr:DGQHR domain-containing protein [Paraburkholderia bannensis]
MPTQKKRINAKTTSGDKLPVKNAAKSSSRGTTSGQQLTKALKTPKKTVAAKTSAPSQKRAKKSTTSENRSLMRSIFEDGGFHHIQSDNIEITFQQRACDIDHIFVYENLIIYCEETTGESDLSGHFTKKDFFHEIVRAKHLDFLAEYRKVNSDFDAFLSESKFNPDDFVFRQVYLSENKSLSDGLLSNKKSLKVMSPSEARYFAALTKTIGNSSRYEVLKYLDVHLADLSTKIQGRTLKTMHSFDAFALSDKQTNYPDGFKVISFYADPESLIRRAYVLRRDGWSTPDASYQRFLKPDKLASMRKHLATNHKVFINNLIVTLPASTQIQDTQGNQIPLDKLDVIHCGQVILPDELGTIGIVDGQHRIFSYHEGRDAFESEIRKLRGRQNLLVTGIVFPPSYGVEDRARFEAQLFLDINNTQSKVRADLRQEIEAIVKPASQTAISKRIVALLAAKSPLKGLLQENLYDSTDRIKTSSLVGYGLLPLVTTTGNSSLFGIWSASDEVKTLSTPDNVEQYVNYCVSEISRILVGAKLNLEKEQWGVKKRGNVEGILSPTTIGGFFNCLRVLISDGVSIQTIDYKAAFSGLSQFGFGGYTSSAWARLGNDLRDQYFPAPKGR